MEMTELLDAAGEYEQPVGTVLRSLAVSLRLVAERMVETEAKLEELTMITDGHHDTMLDEENADQSRT